VPESPLKMGEALSAIMQNLKKVIYRVVHSINEAGFKTSLEAEKGS
jgi:hypothetical protein